MSDMMGLERTEDYKITRDAWEAYNPAWLLDAVDAFTTSEEGQSANWDVYTNAKVLSIMQAREIFHEAFMMGYALRITGEKQWDEED